MQNRPKPEQNESAETTQERQRKFRLQIANVHSEIAHRILANLEDNQIEELLSLGSKPTTLKDFYEEMSNEVRACFEAERATLLQKH